MQTPIVAERPETISDTPPDVQPGHWIQLDRLGWATVTKVFEPGYIECKVVDNRDNAYLRRFSFRNGWWRFYRADPDGSYLPHNIRRSEAQKLKEGPPKVWGASHLIGYKHDQGHVWLHPRDLPPDHPTPDGYSHPATEAM
jgi:hypothetical protein